MFGSNCRKLNGASVKEAPLSFFNYRKHLFIVLEQNIAFLQWIEMLTPVWMDLNGE